MDVTSAGLLQANATIIAGLLIFVTITSLTNIDTGTDTPSSLIFPNPITNLDFNIQGKRSGDTIFYSVEPDRPSTE